MQCLLQTGQQQIQSGCVKTHDRSAPVEDSILVAEVADMLEVEGIDGRGVKPPAVVVGAEVGDGLVVKADVVVGTEVGDGLGIKVSDALGVRVRDGLGAGVASGSILVTNNCSK